MADLKISDLAAAAALTTADLAELEQPGEAAGTRSRKITLALLRAFFVVYDNTASGLTATDFKAAVDELAGITDDLADALADTDGDVAAAVASIATVASNLAGTQSDLDALEATVSGLPGARNTVTALATSGSVAVDVALGDYFTLALAGNVSGFTFSNLPGAGKGATLMIRITQDATARTVAWPASFKWAGGSAGAVSTGSGAVDVLAITTFDNGTTWDATLAKAFA